MNLKLYGSWLAVALPLLWGIFKTFQNALKLFQ